MKYANLQHFKLDLHLLRLAAVILGWVRFSNRLEKDPVILHSSEHLWRQGWVSCSLLYGRQRHKQDRKKITFIRRTAVYPKEYYTDERILYGQKNIIWMKEYYTKDDGTYPKEYCIPAEILAQRCLLPVTNCLEEDKYRFYLCAKTFCQKKPESWFWFAWRLHRPARRRRCWSLPETEPPRHRCRRPRKGEQLCASQSGPELIILWGGGKEVERHWSTPWKSRNHPFRIETRTSWDVGFLHHMMIW